MFLYLAHVWYRGHFVARLCAEFYFATRFSNCSRNFSCCPFGLFVLNVFVTLSSADIGFLHLHAIAIQKFERNWRKQIIVTYSRHDFDYDFVQK